MDEFEMETEEKEKFPLTFEDLLLFEGESTRWQLEGR